MLSWVERESLAAGEYVVAGDWGTSNLRLFLCDSAGRCLDSAAGLGAAACGGRFAASLAALLAPWQERFGPLQTVLCGMVGSNIGWVPTPYLAAPIVPRQIADACTSVEGGLVHIVPGLSCLNPFGAPDFMRGEETQILGALHLDESLRSGRRILALPGTHTKWVVLQDGHIVNFFTAPTGEVFAVLRDHSVLVRNALNGTPDAQQFAEGLHSFNAFSQAQLLHRLFECRARQLAGQLSAPQAESYLSGLLVASDVLGALQLLKPVASGASLSLVGSGELTQLYAAALRGHGIDSQLLDGAAASLAGLLQVHRQLSQAARRAG